MFDTYKSLIANQYEASLCTLNQCLTECPDELWQKPVAMHPFNRCLFHALFFADLYLGLNVDAQPQQTFHKSNADVFGDYEELEDRAPTGTYEKAFLVSYLGHCRSKAKQVIAAETVETLKEPAGFSWLKTTRAEVHVYNVRHIQHHAAQMILQLRKESKFDLPWVKSGWM